MIPARLLLEFPRVGGLTVMPDGRLEVTDALGRRIIHIDKPVY